MTSFIQIVPYLPPTVSGVGDYALILAHGLRDSHNWNTIFVVAHPNEGQTEIEGFAVTPLLDHGRSAISDAFSGHTQVLLHYVGYGYQKRGCPFWLLQSLKAWKRQKADARLATMFHELYANGPPWRSSFWTSPMQRKICHDLARLSDQIVTNREASAEILKRMSVREDVVNLPVFSNVGEPQIRVPIEQREPRLVIFGGAGWRSRALKVGLKDIRAACQMWAIEEVIEIGPGESPDANLGVPLLKMGPLAATEVSSWLNRSRLGFVSYTSSYLEKSGIHAAYAAHGVVPVLPERSLIRNTQGVERGIHYIGPEDGESSLKTLGACSNEVFSWYQGHRIAAQTQVFADLLIKR